MARGGKRVGAGRKPNPHKGHPSCCILRAPCRETHRWITVSPPCLRSRYARVRSAEGEPLPIVLAKPVTIPFIIGVPSFRCPFGPAPTMPTGLDRGGVGGLWSLSAEPGFDALQGLSRLFFGLASRRKGMR
jgi:hypothetical protein